jgi:hypothetical protein
MLSVPTSTKNFDLNIILMISRDLSFPEDEIM